MTNQPAPEEEASFGDEAVDGRLLQMKGSLGWAALYGGWQGLSGASGDAEKEFARLNLTQMATAAAAEFKPSQEEEREETRILSPAKSASNTRSCTFSEPVRGKRPPQLP